jgi:aryl-alcohol dehydrogenase-like predicted oxidoreductase
MAQFAEGTKTPILGLGTFAFSGVFSPVDSSTVGQILNTYVDNGGWYVETAPVYAPNGIDLGAILKSFARDRFFIASKCVTGRDATGATVRSGKAGHLRSQCHGELKRLGVEQLDLLQLHTVPEDATADEAYGALQDLRSAGLVRNVGVSNVSLSQLKTFVATGPVDFVQNRFSFIHRAQHRAIESYCQDNGILLNPYQVIERGLLADNPPPKFREGDLRNSKYEYSGDVYHFIRSWVLSDIKPIGDAAGLSVTALALGWALVQPAIGVVPVGATSPTQVRENLAAGLLPLPHTVISDMEAAFVRLESAVRERIGLSVDEYRGL